MRVKTVEAFTPDEAQNICPWASEIIEIEGGYLCFESIIDAEVWSNQK